MAEGFLKEWALGGPGFILGMICCVEIIAIGLEVPGHERSGLQKSQPVPSLLSRGIKQNEEQFFRLQEEFMDTVYFAITLTHYCVHKELFIAIIYRR